MRGVDTPEIRGLCEQEIQLTILARDYVRDLPASQSLAARRFVIGTPWQGRSGNNRVTALSPSTAP